MRSYSVAIRISIFLNFVKTIVHFFSFLQNIQTTLNIVLMSIFFCVLSTVIIIIIITLLIIIIIIIITAKFSAMWYRWW